MPDAPTDHALPTRVFLAVSAALCVVLGPLVRAQWPDAWDPASARWALGALCLGALAATWTPLGRARASTLGLVVACLMQAWFLHVSHVNGLIMERALNALMLLVVSIVFCRHAWQVLVFLGVTMASIAWAYAGPEPADMPQFVVQTVVVVIGVGAAIATQLRTRLELALRGETAHAEALALEVERRRHAEEEALKASRAKSAFLAHMSHELRTPLTAILGYGELVQEELEGTDAEGLNDDVGRILTSGRHLLGLIDDVLDLARIEAGKVELQLEDVELPALVAECTKLVAPTAAEQGNRLDVDLQGARAVTADAARLRQVLLNLLSNAIKFTQDGEIRVEAELDDGTTHITVRDNGCGIPAEDLPSLFEPFVMVDGDRRVQQGTGLGLAICRELAERMGGELWVESQLGAGSAFTVSLPTAGYSASQSTTSTV